MEKEFNLTKSRPRAVATARITPYPATASGTRAPSGNLRLSEIESSATSVTDYFDPEPSEDLTQTTGKWSNRAEASSPSMDERLAMAIQLYRQGEISHEIAASIAGLSRSEFLETQLQLGISPFQYTADELLEDLMCVEQSRMDR